MRRDLQVLIEAVTTCQKARRVVLARRQATHHQRRRLTCFSQFKQALGRFQLQWRSLHQSRCEASALIQAQWRGSVQRVRFGVLRESVRKIQSQWRGLVARRQYVQTRESLINVQRRYRRKLQLRVSETWNIPFRAVFVSFF